MALRKQAERDPIPFFIVSTVVNSFRIELLDVTAGDMRRSPISPANLFTEKNPLQVFWRMMCCSSSLSRGVPIRSVAQNG